MRYKALKYENIINIVDEMKNYIDKDAPSNTCLSYVKVYFSYDNDSETGAGEYKSEAYINCKKYTTLGYSENKK